MIETSDPNVLTFMKHYGHLRHYTALHQHPLLLFLKDGSPHNFVRYQLHKWVLQLGIKSETLCFLIAVNNNENPLKRFTPEAALASKIIREVTEDDQIMIKMHKSGFDGEYADTMAAHDKWFVPENQE